MCMTCFSSRGLQCGMVAVLCAAAFRVLWEGKREVLCGSMERSAAAECSNNSAQLNATRDGGTVSDLRCIDLGIYDQVEVHGVDALCMPHLHLDNMLSHSGQQMYQYACSYTVCIQFSGMPSSGRCVLCWWLVVDATIARYSCCCSSS
jgi:hypothetical protein